MYDYREAMTEDVKEWIKENVDLTEWAEDREGLEQQLNDDLWTEDSITGNASGSYYCNSYNAEESIAHKPLSCSSSLKCLLNSITRTRSEANKDLSFTAGRSLQDSHIVNCGLKVIAV